MTKASVKYNGQELNTPQILITGTGFERLAKAILATPIIDRNETNEDRIKKSLMNWFDCEPDDWRLAQAVIEIMEIVGESEEQL